MIFLPAVLRKAAGIVLDGRKAPGLLIMLIGISLLRAVPEAQAGLPEWYRRAWQVKLNSIITAAGYKIIS
jgi:hypothetical protein